MSLKSVNGRYGEVWFQGKDEYVGKSLYNYGEFSPEECDYLVGLGGNVVLDVGANIGCVSQALLSAGRTVHAFEPNIQILDMLKKNVAKWEKAIVYDFALSNKEGSNVMPRSRLEDRNNLGGLSIGTKSDLGTIEIKTRTLDSLNIEPFELIKIDVEGHELEVLQGGANTINKYKPIMYIEDDREEKRVGLRAYIKHLGYEFEEHNPPLYSPNNYFGKKVNIWNMNYISKNLICRYAKS